MRKILKIVPFLLLSFLVACARVNPPEAELPARTDYAPRTLYDLGGLASLQALFNEDAGLTRLILLVSPT